MIRLVGPGGAGKTAAGRLLAQRLGVAFVDLDEEFTANVGDISSYLDAHGYDAYAERNVSLYLELSVAARREAVLALSSGFMTYRPDIHPEYENCLREIASNPSTFVLLPSLEFEQCVAETVRRQTSRPFGRSAAREEEVIRARFPIYINVPARKVETMRPVQDVVDALLLETSSNPPPVHITRVITAIALSLALTALVAPARAQDTPTDVIFRNTSLRASISLIANSLQKSVVFDREVPTQRMITFEVRNVSKSEALASLLRQERLYAIELGSVLIVAPDSDESRANYTPQRIAAARIGGDEDRRHDIVVPPARLQQAVETLAKAMKRQAAVDAAIVRESREYGFELRNVSSAEALQILCLVAHLAVRDEGNVLAFTANAAH